ncbi:MAG: right-handed parallel beta-helix repeat-containing protein [Bacteroidetes bacterium]|nr:right-handed parallel beta-helix repeat-containing protein [Bacteroidota bacterium]
MKSSIHKFKFIILAVLLFAFLAILNAAYAADLQFKVKATMNYSPKFVRNGWVSPGNTTYYINPLNGNDDNSGLTEDRAWRTFSHINQLQFSPGDNIEITAAGQFSQTLVLKGKGTVNNPVKVHFAAGNYDFFPDNLHSKKYNISNTNDSPDSLKAVGILLEHAKNFTISGAGANVICRGKMIEVCIDSCENISIAGLHFDYHRPTVSEFTVIAAGDGYADIQIHKDSEYKIENGAIKWIGEGWNYNTGLAQELDLLTNDLRRMKDPLKTMKLEEINPFLIRAIGKHTMKSGCIYQLRDIFRDYAAVFTRGSKNISWKNIHFYFMHGMGLVCQFSENLSFDSVIIAPDKTSGRTSAAWADCMHFSGCKGKLLVRNCIFSGAHDDAINVHGTYLSIVEKIADNQLKVRFMQKQTYGFMAFNRGDEIEFVNHESYESYGLNNIKDALLLNPKEMLLTFEKSAPQGLTIGDVIENVTWTPEVEIRGCKVSRIPTRGFLLSTRRKVLVEGNEFLATHMNALQMAIDANSWYESGYVRDMTIRNNKFILCAEPVIEIAPGNRIANNSVYQNIRIENNEFFLRNEVIVKAKSINKLVVSGNIIYAEKKLNDKLSINTGDCKTLKLSQNKYLIQPKKL